MLTNTSNVRFLLSPKAWAWVGVAALSLPMTACDALEQYRSRTEDAQAKKEQAAQRAEVEAKGEEYRASGADFSVPVPSGYTQAVNKELLKMVGPGGFAFAADKRVNDGWFLASIAFARAGDLATAADEVATETACKSTAKSLADGAGGTLTRAGHVTVGVDQRCQWRFVNADANRGTTGTAMLSPSSVWVVTCNHDARDAAAKAVCAEVLAGWNNSKQP